MKSKKQIIRCEWCTDDDLYINYHDHEWGVPLHDDSKLFELFTLEGAQAGLSWLTVLRKRDGYRKAFDNFNIDKIAKYGDKKINELCTNPNIIRNKLKINSVVGNAKAIKQIQKESGSFDKYLWDYVSNNTIKNSPKSIKDLPKYNEVAIKLSKDLKNRGMNFVGPTICYSFMQAIGMIDDHVINCIKY